MSPGQAGSQVLGLHASGHPAVTSLLAHGQARASCTAWDHVGQSLASVSCPPEWTEMLVLPQWGPCFRSFSSSNPPAAGASRSLPGQLGTGCSLEGPPATLAAPTSSASGPAPVPGGTCLFFRDQLTHAARSASGPGPACCLRLSPPCSPFLQSPLPHWVFLKSGEAFT